MNSKLGIETCRHRASYSNIEINRSFIIARCIIISSTKGLSMDDILQPEEPSYCLSPSFLEPMIEVWKKVKLEYKKTYKVHF